MGKRAVSGGNLDSANTLSPALARQLAEKLKSGDLGDEEDGVEDQSNSRS